MRPEEIGLTDRQSQVLALMVRGMSNRDIAEQLQLSEGTVKIHATAVFKTLGVASRTQALVAVSRYGIDFENVFEVAREGRAVWPGEPVLSAPVRRLAVSRRQMQSSGQ